MVLLIPQHQQVGEANMRLRVKILWTYPPFGAIKLKWCCARFAAATPTETATRTSSPSWCHGDGDLTRWFDFYSCWNVPLLCRISCFTCWNERGNCQLGGHPTIMSQHCCQHHSTLDRPSMAHFKAPQRLSQPSQLVGTGQRKKTAACWADLMFIFGGLYWLLAASMLVVCQASGNFRGPCRAGYRLVWRLGISGRFLSAFKVLYHAIFSTTASASLRGLGKRWKYAV